MKTKQSIGTVIGLILISYLGLHAQQSGQWTATFTLPATSYVLGEPIVGEIVLHNSTSSCLPSPGLFGAFYLDGGTAPCRAYDAPPTEQMPALPPGVTYGPPSVPHMEQPGASRVFPVNISHLCFDRQTRNPLGEHHLCFQWDPTSGRAPLCVTFTVQAPTGEDAAAYQVFKGDPLAHPADLLQRFPTSTYTAHIVYQRSGAEGLSESDPSKIAEALTGGMGLMGEIWVPVPGATDKSGLAPLSGQAAVDWRLKWFNIILTNHPDIWFADQLRLKRAVDQVALKNYQVGAADLQTLSQQAKPDVAQKAQTILSAMKQKGWIKN